MNYPVAARPHSGLGIAATVVAVFAGLCTIASVGFATKLAMDAGGQPDPNDPQMMATSLAMMAGLAMHLLGILLGIAGLFVGERRRLFSWIGLILNLLPLLTVLVLGGIGLAMQ